MHLSFSAATAKKPPSANRAAVLALLALGSGSQGRCMVAVDRGRRDRVVVARAGRQQVDPDKRNAAIMLIEAGLSPTEAARQVGLGRATVYKLKAQRSVTVVGSDTKRL